MLLQRLRYAMRAKRGIAIGQDPPHALLAIRLCTHGARDR
jgi:hypothetical protein